jgi:broad specificity phosphatase PhoE
MTSIPNIERIEHDAVTLALAKKEKIHHFVGMDEVYEAMRLKPLRVTAYALNDPSAPSENVKICHFLRHGQGFHNLMADMFNAQGKVWTQFQNTADNPYVMPEVVDAPLTHKGRNQARAAQPIIDQLEVKPELIISSSQCRALQTSLIAFEQLIDSVPFLVHEMVREESGVHVCDRRRPKSQQMVDFPAFDFSAVAEEEDSLFREDRRETKMEVGERIYSFFEWLEERDETHVAIASHSGWLLTVFNAVVESKDETLKQWFQTGELRSVKLTFEKIDEKK